jgi:hypothetical protein
VRIDSKSQLTQPWLIHGLVHDFELEDVWALPGIGGTRDDFEAVVRLVASTDPSTSSGPIAGGLWKARDILGRWFGIGEVTSGPQAAAHSIAARVPAELRGSAADISFGRLPFVPLYRTATEFAAEIENATVHGVMHLSWLQGPGGAYAPQMAVYVKPNGWFGRAYMASIKPFRYLIVYPAMERAFTERWAMR